MVEWIFRRWPHIQEQQECYSDALYLWKSRMKTYFKNTRSRSSVPEITTKRNICGKNRRHDDSGASSAWGMVNYKPVFDQGEDEFSMYDHAEELRKHFSLSKNCQNADLIKVLMNKAFPDCRFMLVEEMLLISDVVEKYPGFCSEEQVCMKLF